MITYVCGGVIRNKIQLSVNTLTGWITGLHKKSQPQQFQFQDNIRDNMYVYIPEVAFELREPLVGQDYLKHEAKRCVTIHPLLYYCMYVAIALLYF